MAVIASAFNTTGFLETYGIFNMAAMAIHACDAVLDVVASPRTDWTSAISMPKNVTPAPILYRDV